MINQNNFYGENDVQNMHQFSVMYDGCTSLKGIWRYLDAVPTTVIQFVESYQKLLLVLKTFLPDIIRKIYCHFNLMIKQ